MSKNFYITTTLPYVNADPHMGHALEFVQADIIARYKKLLGDEVFFNIGTDEHGLKIYRKAQEEGMGVEDYVDKYAGRFITFAKDLNLSEHNFIRTTDVHHLEAARFFWKKCHEAGFIEKKKQSINYCVGCELEKTESELTDGKCPEHPNLEMEVIEEENYFFKLSKFQNELLKLYKERKDFVIPETRFNEIRKFVENGLQDFSISRLKEKMPWGVEVPDDTDHVMYVWFDALVNYISCIGWPDDLEKFNKWWPVIQIAGKDQLRPQIVMWQAMLMSLGLKPSKQILIHGFITTGKQKMSKSLGNVVGPIEIIEKFGTDALRYYLAREVATFEDSDFTEELFKETYNANLANGLGNLVSRIMKMAVSYDVAIEVPEYNTQELFKELPLKDYEIQKTADIVWKEISGLDEYIQKTEPFKTIKTDEMKAKRDIQYLVKELMRIAILLEPFLPGTSQEIQRLIKEKKTPETPLFARID